MKKTIEIDSKNIRQTCLEADCLFKEWNILQDDNEDLVLALDEALTNIYEHGYCTSDHHKHIVNIEIFKGDDKVYIMISDEASHFSFENVSAPERSTYVNSKVIGGFGIPIIKKIMSDVRHFQLFDENVLIMRKEVRCRSGNTPILSRLSSPESKSDNMNFNLMLLAY